MVIIAVSILGSCLLAALVLCKAWRLRRAIYRYDVGRDQRYDFSRCNPTRVEGELRDGKLDVPPSPRPGGAVLLELTIRPTLLGRWFEPYVDIGSTYGRWRQPFERGGSGLRCIDLSPMLGKGSTPLRLTGRHLEIPDQAVVLLYLDPRVDLDRERILVLGTHPDDAEIAAFGVYCRRDAYVVTLTAGEDGEIGPFWRFGADAHREKGRHRAWNSVAVPMLGGLTLERTANLGYFDGTLTAMKAKPEVPVRSLRAGVDTLEAFGQLQDAGLIESRKNRAATWVNLVADIEHLVTRIQPDILVAPYPRLDAHPDHQMSTVALIEALENLGWKRGSLLLYVNHLCCSDRYPFGNAGDLVSLPPGVGDIFFDGIVSNPLDPGKQAQKHMALDAMIDLRSEVRIESVRNVANALKQSLKAALTDMQANYFRQAVRPNELFFEVRVSSLFEPGVIERIIGGSS